MVMKGLSSVRLLGTKREKTYTLSDK